MEATLEHAYLTVQDMDRTLAFYRRLLPGWVVRWEGNMGGRWIHFGPPGDGQPGYLSLYEDRGAKKPKDPPYSSLRIEHIGFAHPDVNGLVASLQEAKIEATELADDGKYRRAYFEDPDGHELEFVQKL